MTTKHSAAGKKPNPINQVLPPRYQRIKTAQLSGGYGVVEKVHDTFLDRTVVFKTMQDSQNKDQHLNEILAA